MEYKLNTACAECPFRTTAIKGYTGPYPTAKDMIIAAQRWPYACHSSPGQGNPTHPEAQHCYGAAVMARKSACLSRDPDTAEYQRKVGKDDPEIMDQWQTMERHSFFAKKEK